MANQTKLPPLEEITSAYLANISHSGQVLQVTLISSKPRILGLILEYLVTYRTEDGEIKKESLIGKMYFDESKGLASFQFLQYLWENGFTDEPRYTIVRPIAYLPHWKILLMSKAPGKRLDDCLHDPNIDGNLTAFLIANWLTHMHSTPLTETRATTQKRGDIDVKPYYEELTALIPEEETRLKSIYHQFLQKLDHPSINPVVLLHGDFHTRNIFIGDSQIVAIDFDHHFIDDPAWDVAYLACQIQISSYFKKGDFHYLQPVVKHFIDTYLHTHPSYNRESFFDRLALYSAHTLFESLRYELCVLKTGKLTILEPFLTECQLNLQGNGFK
jgi:hypothetical protein